MEALYGFAGPNGLIINRQPSVQRYAIQLNAIVGGGGTLSDEQKADMQILLAGAAIEQAILDKMMLLINEASTDPAGALAAAQTPAPDGLAALVELC